MSKHGALILEKFLSVQSFDGMLMLSMLGENFNRRHCEIFFLFFP